MKATDYFWITMLMFVVTEPIEPPQDFNEPCALILHLTFKGSSPFLLHPQINYRLGFAKYRSEIVVASPFDRVTTQTRELNVSLHLIPQVTKIHMRTPCGVHTIKAEIDLCDIFSSLENR